MANNITYFLADKHAYGYIGCCGDVPVDAVTALNAQAQAQAQVLPASFARRPQDVEIVRFNKRLKLLKAEVGVSFSPSGSKINWLRLPKAPRVFYEVPAPHTANPTAVQYIKLMASRGQYEYEWGLEVDQVVVSAFDFHLNPTRARVTLTAYIEHAGSSERNLDKFKGLVETAISGLAEDVNAICAGFYDWKWSKEA